MTKMELIFIREDIFENEPDKKVIIAEFNEPPITGDYLVVAEEMESNSWAKQYNEEFMEMIKGETYKVTERIFTGDVLMLNLEPFDATDGVGGFISKLGIF